MKKTLVVYYSRTGTTKTVAEEIAKELKADIDVIVDNKKRSGVLGYLLSGKEGTFKSIPEIRPAKLSPANYDLVIIGTPIWGGNMSSPVRAYITKYKDKIKDTAFFCTFGGQGAEKTFKEMGEILGKKPKAVVFLKTRQVKKNEYLSDVKDFVKKCGY